MYMPSMSPDRFAVHTLYLSWFKKEVALPAAYRFLIVVLSCLPALVHKITGCGWS